MKRNEFEKYLKENRYDILKQIINTAHFKEVYTSFGESNGISLASIFYNITRQWNKGDVYNYHVYPGLIIGLLEGIITFPSDGILMLHSDWSCDGTVIPIITDVYTRFTKKRERWNEDDGYEYNERLYIKDYEFHYIDNDGQISLTIKNITRDGENKKQNNDKGICQKNK